jgi:hypothetical protein
MTKMHVWETLRRSDYEGEKRMKVPGGWLYMHWYPANESDGYGKAIVFVPDPPPKLKRESAS